MSSIPPAVQTVELTKSYRIGHVDYPALKGVSIKIMRGELTSVIGPSGSGKSTLLNLVGALDYPTSGRVYIDGVDLRKLNDDQLSLLRNRKIGFVYQSFNLVHRLTAGENVQMPLIARGLDTRSRQARALRALNVVGLDRKAHKRPTELSGGEQQRVAIARALVTQPSLVIADEPTGNLDSKTTDDIMRKIIEINRNSKTTFIIVTHNLEIAEKTQRTISIRDGMVEKDEYIHRLDSFTGPEMGKV
jgi:putative ABC transport system ATP-binding protein